jgi:3-oxoacyl-[acyl-carrier-protein] synthase-3
MVMRALIAGCGGYLPPLRLSNDELAARHGLETSDAWIQDRTGIKYRHVAAPNEAASDLAAAAPPPSPSPVAACGSRNTKGR